MKAKVDMLYGEKREKEFDMENLRNTSRRLMDDDRVCDQFVMKESLSEVEAKWHELTELLVQQVSLEVGLSEIFFGFLSPYKCCLFIPYKSCTCTKVLYISNILHSCTNTHVKNKH